MADSLEECLEASLSGRILSRNELPSEAEQHAVHAQLARGVREQRRFRSEPIDEQQAND
jgi:hypothetical protein